MNSLIQKHENESFNETNENGCCSISNPVFELTKHNLNVTFSIFTFFMLIL